MKITFTDAAKADVFAFIVDEDGGLPPAAAALDKSTGGLLTEAIDGRFTGKKDQQAVVVLPKGAEARRAVLIGGGKPKKRDARVLEGLGANLVKAFNMSGFKSLAIHAGSAEDAARMAVGAKLAAYRFDTYFTRLKPDQKPSLTAVMMVVDDIKAGKAAFAPLDAASDGTILARDLVNMPPNDLHPASFAAKIQELESLGVEVEILGEKQMAKLGMGALLGVGQGSAHDSRLGIMKWNGGKDGEDPVILVGKGVCFDTGGISLKPGPGMEDMRGDMGGAAAVTGTIRALAERKAKVNAVGLIGLVENMPDANAIRPGDILKSASGQTIEVQNTDAEGRLVLADVIWYTNKRFKPKFMVNLATLTGAIIVALGHHQAGLFSNNDELAANLFKAGLLSGELVWRLPLSADYDKLIDSKFADMKNVGGRWAGSITAGQFLQRYVNDVPWAHLDIAGTAMASPKNEYSQSWGSGFGVRLLDRLVADNYE